MKDWETDRDRERRETVRRHHVLKDREEDFHAAKASTTDPDDRRLLNEEMYGFRRAHREEDVRRGKRPLRSGVTMRQNMWARWLEVSAEHLELAETAHAELQARRRDDAMMDELRASLVVCTAATATIEALYEDVRYLIPLRPRKRHRADQMSDCIAAVFGLPESQESELRRDLKELFTYRDESLHGYTEARSPREHPLGFRTGSEMAVFNALECRRYMGLALDVLGFSDYPSSSTDRWVSRWVNERSAYHLQVVRPIRDAFSNPGR